MKRLSKSRYQTGLQCPRALWLKTYRSSLADPITEVQQQVFDTGHAVGRLAHGLFPGGMEVTEDHTQSAAALESTRKAIEQGALVLYEPAFEFGGVFVRVDILVRRGDAWDLYEVKSSTKVKPEHITDAAVQTWVVEGAGLPVGRSHIVHVDNTYVWPGGDYDLSRLFAVRDVTADVRSYLPHVGPTVEALQAMLDGDLPETRLGSRCGSPYPCAFLGWCHGERLPTSHPVTELPYLSDKALGALLDSGVTCVLDIPDGFPMLSENQAATVEVVKSGAPYADLAGLARGLAVLEYPLYHLDFETTNPGLPVWPGTRPYEAVPFQYSIHVEQEDGSVEHRSYLHTEAGDPRGPLARHLLADLGEAGSVVHYSAYERRILDGLAGALPELATRISKVTARLFDLEAVVRANTKHPEAAGRTSIKYVLPAWCDDLSYAGLGIQDGQTASTRYFKAITGRLGSADACRAVFDDLEVYCGLDTLAMVRLLDRMRELAAG